MRYEKEAKSDGQVFSLTDFDTVLTIKDSVGGGIYGDDWGPFYFGGDVVISGNIGNGVANPLI